MSEGSAGAQPPEGRPTFRAGPRGGLKRLSAKLAEYDVLLEAFYFFGGIAIAVISVWLVIRQLDQVNVQIVQANNLTWEQAIDNRLTVLLEKMTEQFPAQCIAMDRPEVLHKACRKLYRESPEAVSQAMVMAIAALDAIQEARALAKAKQSDPKFVFDPTTGADHEGQVSGWIASLETDPFGLVRWLIVYNGFGDSSEDLADIEAIWGMRIRNVEAGAAAFEELLLLDPEAPLTIPPALPEEPAEGDAPPAP